MKKIVYAFATLVCAVNVFAVYGMHDPATTYVENLDKAIKAGRKEDVQKILTNLTVKGPSHAIGEPGEWPMAVGTRLALDRDVILTHALVEAIRQGDFGIVYMLVNDFGADVNSKKGLAMTPLAFAKFLDKKGEDRGYIIGFLMRKNAIE